MQLTTNTPTAPVRRRRRPADSRDGLGRARNFTLSQARTSAEHLDRLDAALDALGDGGEELELDVDLERPRTRGDCATGPRPCPFVGCRHHLALEVKENGSLLIVDGFAFRGHTCSLDVADRGEHTLDVVGQLLNLTRQRVGQLERKGLEKAAARARFYGVGDDALAFFPEDHTEIP